MLKINHDLCTLCEHCISVCPFGALELRNDRIEVLDACRLCKICVRQCPVEAMYIETQSATSKANLDARDILVVAEFEGAELHPVTLELIGKGREMADKISANLGCVLIGHGSTPLGEYVLDYGVDRAFVFDYQDLEHFRIEPYTNAVEAVIKDFDPAVVLFAATPVGRSLAPRVAARCRTGLTADCTTLEVRSQGELVQIRPAFGGNIMAQIITPKHRPQMATMRYKIMDPAKPRRNSHAKVEHRTLSSEELDSAISIINVETRPPEASIADAEIIVAAGRGIGDRETLALVEELAQLLGGQVGVTRPLVEAGWADYTQQIGLSGRAIRPKLLITVGVSGAVQFTASVTGAEVIVAINNDPEAPIFQVAHYGLVGDLHEVLPALINDLQEVNAHAV